MKSEMLKYTSFMKILLLTPPMTQVNTPYPATAYLTGFLRSRGYWVDQSDPAIQLVLRLFSQQGLKQIFKELHKRPKFRQEFAFFLENFDKYLGVIEPTIFFLQGKDPSLALRIVTRDFLPEGPRFRAIGESALSEDPDPIAWAFGSLGVGDRAKYLASLFLDDLVDVIQKGIDPRFELSRYGDGLAASASLFDPLHQALHSKPTLVDLLLDEISTELIQTYKPQIVGMTVPFPGNVYGAFRIILGGGYVNTELRQLNEPRVFDYFDFITLDDGERPLLCLLEYLEQKVFCKEASLGIPLELPNNSFCRTFVLESAGKSVPRVIYKNNPEFHDIPHRETGIPTYDGLKMDCYLSIFEMLNPMHRIWSDGRWNKLTLAHGCYWRKCNFCDVTLDYIGRYDPASIDILVDRIESLIKETGQRGFHFVDEAAPPAILKALSERLIQRKICITWWGNVRFDKGFTPELTNLLSKAGCVAVSGGLEVASDRLLKLMQKGVTVEQVARVTQAFTNAGIMVHAYLMYGFPTQTEQETIDSLERVRQLFEAGCIQSAYWHQFSVTAHSPIGRNPEKFGIQILSESKVTFAKNDLKFIDTQGCDPSQLGEGLKKAIYNYMHGVGLDLDIRVWFDQRGKKCLIPATKVPRDLIQRSLPSK